jgi:hypothetical protein
MGRMGDAPNFDAATGGCTWGTTKRAAAGAAAGLEGATCASKATAGASGIGWSGKSGCLPLVGAAAERTALLSSSPGWRAADEAKRLIGVGTLKAGAGTPAALLVELVGGAGFGFTAAGADVSCCSGVEVAADSVAGVAEALAESRIVRC